MGQSRFKILPIKATPHPGAPPLHYHPFPVAEPVSPPSPIGPLISTLNLILPTCFTFMVFTIQMIQPLFPPGELLQGPHQADCGRGEAICCDLHQLREAKQELEPS